MKMKFLDRILLFVGAFLTAVSGLGVFLVGLGVDRVSVSIFGLEGLVINRWLILVIGVLLFAFGIYLLSLPRSGRKNQGDFVIQQTAGGELRISVKAMESLVHKVMASHEEMSLKGLTVDNRRDGVVIDLKVAMAGNISIPLAVTALQKEVRQHLLSASGVDVKEVRVSVETADTVATDSPFLMQDPPVAEVKASAEETLGPQEKHGWFGFGKKPAEKVESQTAPDTPLISEDTQSAHADEQHHEGN